MAKLKRIKLESIDSKGDKKTIYLQLPDSEENKEAQLAYNRAFREALQSGAVLRQKLNKVMEEQGVWDDAKEAEYNTVLEQIHEGERTLSKGGISLNEARELAIEMRKCRTEFRALIAERSSMDSNTAEGQADNERFSHLLYACLKDDKGAKLFKTKEDYEKKATEPYVIQAAGELAEKLYGLDPNYEKNLPENKFLQSYKFTDHALRLINDNGHLIDIDEEGVERLIDENGRFVTYDKEGGQSFVDKDGNVVTEEGDYDNEFKPFLDAKGKEVPVPEGEGDDEAEAQVKETAEPEAKVEAEAETEEVKEETAEKKKPAKRGRPKKTQSETQTE